MAKRLRDLYLLAAIDDLLRLSDRRQCNALRTSTDRADLEHRSRPG